VSSVWRVYVSAISDRCGPQEANSDDLKNVDRRQPCTVSLKCMKSTGIMPAFCGCGVWLFCGDHKCVIEIINIECLNCSSNKCSDEMLS
jgi:hypothetical protein